MKDNKKEFFDKFVELRPTLGNQLLTRDADILWNWIEAKLAEAKEEAEKEAREELIRDLSKQIDYEDWDWALDYFGSDNILDDLMRRLKKLKNKYIKLNSKTN